MAKLDTPCKNMHDCSRALYRIVIYRLYLYFGYMIHIVSFILVT